MSKKNIPRTIAIYPGGEGRMDTTLTATLREILAESTHRVDTISALCEDLGIGYRRARSLLDLFDLRDRFRDYGQKTNDSA